MLADLLPRRALARDYWLPSFDVNTYAGLWDQVAKLGFNGVQYILPGGGGFKQLEAEIGVGNTIVAGCMALRAAVFSEARFAWQRLRNGRPGDLYGTPELAKIERPWPGATAGDLLKRCEADDTLHGNSFWVWDQFEQRAVRLDPCRTVIATGDAYDPITGIEYGKVLIGYHLLDRVGGSNVVGTWLPGEVAHYYTIPDPCHEFRGVSWLSSVLADVTADRGLTQYKSMFIENAATPALAITYPPEIEQDAVVAMKAAMDAAHKGVRKAFKTLHLGLGGKPEKIGANFQDLDMSGVQGGGETRIALAAGIPAAILGAKEALQGSSLNSGNYSAARRRWADGSLRPAWRSWCGAFQNIVQPPDEASRLWYYDGDISFLQEDVKDAADIKFTEAQALRQLTDAGFTPESAIEAITTGDYTRLKHSGLYSVQLQKPGATAAPAGANAA